MNTPALQKHAEQQARDGRADGRWPHPWGRDVRTGHVPLARPQVWGPVGGPRAWLLVTRPRG